MILDAYIRVSRVGGRQGETFISPRAQREKIELYCKLRGYAIAEWFEDLDQPGTKATRPGFVRVLERVESGETNGVIVAKLDRFARSLGDASRAIARISKVGGQLVSVDDQFDTSTPTGRLALNILLAFAEFEVDRIRESWKTAQAMAVRRGVHIASRCPTGYRRRDDGRLEPDAAAAAAVAEIFRARASGASLRECGDILEAAGVVGPYDNKHWAASAVATLLRNPVYLGEARSGVNKNPDAHVPLIDAATWRAAQEIRGRTARGSGGLLSGILRCAGCRYVMKTDQMKLRDGGKARIYRCRGDHAAGVCPDRAAVLGRVIEPYVVERFLGEVGNLRAQLVPSSADVAALRLALDEAETELAAWRDEESIVAIGRDLYLSGLRAREERAGGLARELHRSLAALGRDLPSAADLRATWPTLPLADQRALLGSAIDAVILRPGKALPIEKRALFLWRGDAPDDLPRRGRRVPLRPFIWPDDDVATGMLAPDDGGEGAGD